MKVYIDTIKIISDSLNINLNNLKLNKIIKENTEDFLIDIIKLSNRIKKKKFKKKLTYIELNQSLKEKKYNILYGYKNFNKNYQIISNSNLLVILEKFLQIDNLIKKNLLSYPKEYLFKFHWLSINGNQPLLKENKLYVLNFFFHFLLTI